MQEYRAYIVGPDGHVEGRFNLHCSNEAEAIKLAKQFVNDHDVELWQLDRKIATFGHTSNTEALGQSGWRSLISDSA
jgi:hypothetical protein